LTDFRTKLGEGDAVRGAAPLCFGFEISSHRIATLCSKFGALGFVENYIFDMIDNEGHSYSIDYAIIRYSLPSSIFPAAFQSSVRSSKPGSRCLEKENGADCRRADA
jgi:hypothetical protein